MIYDIIFIFAFTLAVFVTGVWIGTDQIDKQWRKALEDALNKEEAE